jgi:8-oxo-dGTP pyrophosphatase MutT (NUDIX family)
MDQPPIPAATLVVVREPPAGPPELLMVERAVGMAFAGGALVFPGGRIDEGDLSWGDGDKAARVAAVRETLEETAVPVALCPVPDAETTQQLQSALLADEPLDALLDRHRLWLDLDRLVPLARWVPKFHAARRFDTLFFLARASGPDWEPRIVAGECTSATWISAAEALERDRSGEARLIFPTRRNLERLAQHDSFEAMRADATAHAIDPITPWVEEIDGENFITIPAGLGYPVTRERLDGLWRG